MPRRPAAAPLALVAIVIAIAGPAPAANGYQCGADGHPDLAARRCACPAGKVEVTDKKGISHCVVAMLPPKSTATATSKAAPSTCGADMVAIPGGSFTVGGRSASSSIAPFCLDETEVTVAAFERCTKAGKCTEPDPYVAVDPDPKWRIACNWKNPGRSKHPVNCVDLPRASAYCVFAGKRLPTEDEWEWAARGGDEARTYPWGNDLPTAKLANVCGAECAASAKAKLGMSFATMAGVDDAWPESAPVGSLPAGKSRWGALDLAGNVNEWTTSPFVFGSPNVVVRGGAWDSYQYLALFTSNRRGFPPTMKNAVVGFRCAKTK